MSSTIWLRSVRKAGPEALICCALASCAAGHVSSVPAPIEARRNSRTNVARAPAERANRVTRTLLAKAPLADLSGFESRLYLVEFPAGSEMDASAYTEQCVGYVLEGRFTSASGDEPATLKQAGEGFLVLPNRRRFQNFEPGRPVRLLLAGAFREDEPLLRGVPETTGFAPGAELPARALASGAARGPVTAVTRSLLVQREIADLPGREARIYLIEFPPAASAKLHLHTAPGVGYVLEGSFESAFGDEPATNRRAGEAFVDLAGKPHHFKNADATRPLRFVVAGIYHRDEPLFQELAASKESVALRPDLTRP
jgi:quercetin dioxygenase-like cupin family protein